MIQQMGRERVPKGVGRERPGEPDLLSIPLDAMPEGLPGHGPALLAGEQDVSLSQPGPPLSAFLQPAQQPAMGFFSQGHQPFLPTLTQNAHRPLAKVHHARGEAHEFGNAQAAGVKHLEHSPISKPKKGARIRGSQQRLYLGFR